MTNGDEMYVRLLITWISIHFEYYNELFKNITLTLLQVTPVHRRRIHSGHGHDKQNFVSRI